MSLIKRLPVELLFRRVYDVSSKIDWVMQIFITLAFLLHGLILCLS